MIKALFSNNSLSIRGVSRWQHKTCQMQGYIAHCKNPRDGSSPSQTAAGRQCPLDYIQKGNDECTPWKTEMDCTLWKCTPWKTGEDHRDREVTAIPMVQIKCIDLKKYEVSSNDTRCWRTRWWIFTQVGFPVAVKKTYLSSRDWSPPGHLEACFRNLQLGNGFNGDDVFRRGKERQTG